MNDELDQFKNDPVIQEALQKFRDEAKANEATNTCAVAINEPAWKSSFRKLLGAYWKHHETKLPDGYKDAVINRCEITIDWKDFFRILLGCKLQVNTVTFCENIPGKIKTEVHVFAVLK